MNVVEERGAAGAASGEDFAVWAWPYLAPMRRYACRLVPDGDADDVVQEALVRAWRRWSTYDPDRGAPLPWMLGIVADQARRRRTRARLTAPWRSEPDVTYLEPADVDLERAIRGLSGRQRTAITLYYFVDLDVAGVADVMRCTPGTVQATLHQARARLARMLGDDDE